MPQQVGNVELYGPRGLQRVDALRGMARCGRATASADQAVSRPLTLYLGTGLKFSQLPTASLD